MNTGICTVVVRLNRNSDLHIRTTATHALEVVSGRTLFAANDVTVFGFDGNALPMGTLILLKEDEQKK